MMALKSNVGLKSDLRGKRGQTTFSRYTAKTWSVPDRSPRKGWEKQRREVKEPARHPAI